MEDRKTKENTHNKERVESINWKLGLYFFHHINVLAFMLVYGY